MKISKIMTVVFTLITAIIITLDYMVAVKVATSVNSIASVINEAKNAEIIEVSSTEFAKSESINTTRGTVTSRSGMRKSLENISAAVAPKADESQTDVSQAEVQIAEPTNEQVNSVESIDSVHEVVENTENPIQETTQEVAATEEVAQEKPSYGGVELAYSARYNISSSRLTKSKGVTYYNGHKETYYSQRVLPGKGLKMLNSNGRHVADDGTVRDGDGYIAVACNYLPKGSEIMTSLGPGKVYDTGSMTGKWIDIYVNW